MKTTPNELHALILSNLIGTPASAIQHIAARNGKLRALRFCTGDAWTHVQEDGVTTGSIANTACGWHTSTDWARRWIGGPGLSEAAYAEGGEGRLVLAKPFPQPSAYAGDPATAVACYNGTAKSGSFSAMPIAAALALVLSGRALPKTTTTTTEV